MEEEQEQLWDIEQHQKHPAQEQQEQSMDPKHLIVQYQQHKRALQQHRGNRQQPGKELHQQASELYHQRDPKRLQYEWIMEGFHDVNQHNNKQQQPREKEQHSWNESQNSWTTDQHYAGKEELMQGTRELQIDYYADDEGSPEIFSSQSTPSRQGLSPDMSSTDSARESRYSQPSRSENLSGSSSFFSDVPASNRSRAKSRTPRDKSSFISAITSQLPSLLHQLVSPDVSKMSTDEHFTELIKFLEEKVPDSLQDPASTADNRLLARKGEMSDETTGNKSPSLGHSHTDSEIINTTSFFADLFPSSLSDYESHGGSHLYSTKSTIGRKMTRSNISESEYLSSRMSNEHVTRLVKSSPLSPTKSRDKKLRDFNSHFIKTLVSRAARQACSPREATGDSNVLLGESSEKSNPVSSTDQELLSISSASRLSDFQPEATTQSSGDSDFILSSQKTSLDILLSSSEEHYSAFLDFLEQMKVFVALQDVVDEAVHKLIKPVKEEESSSLNTSTESGSFEGDEAEYPALNEANINEKQCDSCGRSDFSGLFPSENCSSSSSFILKPEPKSDSEHNVLSSSQGSSTETHLECLSPVRMEGFLSPSLFGQPQESSDPQVPVTGIQFKESLAYETSVLSESQSFKSSRSSLQSKEDSLPLTKTSSGSDSSSPRAKFSLSRSEHLAVPKTKSKTPSSLSRVAQPKAKQRTPSLTNVTPAKPKSTPPRTTSKSVEKVQKPKHVSPRVTKSSSERKESSQTSKELTSEELDYLSSWLSSSRKLDSAMTGFPSSTSSGFSALQYFSAEEVLDCILEHIVQLMVYKYKTEKSLEGKIGVMAKPFTDPYLERIFHIRNSRGKGQSRSLMQPLSLHEENCLASHPLWASSKTNRRYHLPWKSSSMNYLKQSELYSTSVISSQQDSSPSALPEIKSFSVSSAHTARPLHASKSEQVLELRPISRNNPKTVLPKI
ncbi:uncharacterized protein LOC115073555 [Rhinatrema bivittatum]|uniref:uncharacterized protein LOC115073555 n=1 Tax=Rhinatrema bivittatum TaxID=194408 RepID=UPI00112B1838|nr:uncharacterized protein LOC115073555 [Rhinatrema bivittatum]